MSGALVKVVSLYPCKTPLPPKGEFFSYKLKKADLINVIRKWLEY